jgi:hypothetical protein
MQARQDGCCHPAASLTHLCCYILGGAFQHPQHSQALQRLVRRDPGVRGVTRGDQRPHCSGQHAAAHPGGGLAPVRVALVLAVLSAGDRDLWSEASAGKRSSRENKTA